VPDLRLETGVTLSVDITGPDGADTVLLANGLTMSIAAWDGLTARLSSEFRVVRYDMRGQGRSESPPGPHRPEAHAADLHALVRSLGLRDLHLVGLSNGGLVAMLTAARLEDEAPGTIDTLAVIDAFGRVDAHLRLVLRSWRAALDAGGPGLRFDVAAPWVWGQRFLAEHEGALVAQREVAAGAAPERVASLVDGLAGFEGNAWSALRALDRPVLAICGEDDVLTPVRCSAEIVRGARDGRLVVVEGAGHAAPVERPEAIDLALREFWMLSGEGRPARRKVRHDAN
jgi:3-oxoadipate enol-lactonase